jgi:hypothetical protein
LAEKYLGLPMAFGRSTSEAFEFMPSRIQNLIGNWSGKEANCVGREVPSEIYSPGNTDILYDLFLAVEDDL